MSRAGARNSRDKWRKPCQLGTPTRTPRPQAQPHWASAQDFPGGSVVKNLPASARDAGSFPDAEVPRASGQGLHHSYWACAQERGSHDRRAQEP